MITNVLNLSVLDFHRRGLAVLRVKVLLTAFTETELASLARILVSPEYNVVNMRTSKLRNPSVTFAQSCIRCLQIMCFIELGKENQRL